MVLDNERDARALGIWPEPEEEFAEEILTHGNQLKDVLLAIISFDFYDNSRLLCGCRRSTIRKGGDFYEYIKNNLKFLALIYFVCEQICLNISII